MKILHVIDSGGLYGAETMMLHLMTEHQRMGLHPLLASIGVPGDTEKPLEVKARQSGLDVVSFRMRPGLNWSGAMNILRYARQEQVDLLHSHGYKGNILFGLLPSMVRGLPQVSTLHGWTAVGGLSRLRLYEWLESFSLRRLDRVVLVNNDMLQFSRLKWVPRRKLAVIENGIPLEFNTDAGAIQAEIQTFIRNRFTFGAIGRLSAEKGFCVLLEAFAQIVADGSDVQLVILGEGGQRAILEEEVKRLQLEHRVLLPGFVAEAKNYLPLFDAFVMPSLTEGLPMVLLEAMAAGVPIVATRVGGIPRVLGGEQGGLLVEAGNTDALRHAMIAVGKDEQAAKIRVEWASRCVKEKYSSQTMAKKYYSIYKTLLF